MSLPTITGTGRLTGDPALAYTPSGKPYAKFTVAFNARLFNPQTNAWENGDAFFARCTVWENLAEHAAQSLKQGMEVIAQGSIRSTQWSDKNTGETRYGTEVTLTSLGPTLRWSPVQVPDTRGAAPASSGGAPSPDGTAPRQDEPPF